MRRNYLPVNLKAFVAILTLVFVGSAYAANWYVRPSSQGSNTGTDWNNAWSSSNLNSAWSSVRPGDTVWLAGGTYNTGIRPTVSGTSANPIQVKRVTSTDAAPTAAAGWNASFDSQVIIDATGPGVNYSAQNVGSYFIFDGRVQNGMRFYSNQSITDDGGPHGAVMFSPGSGNQTNISFYNCDLAGPCPVGKSASYNQPYYSSALIVYCYTGGSYLYPSNLLFDHCDLHGGVDCVNTTGLRNSTFQYCRMYDICGTTSHHSNFWEISGGGSGNITFRYNDVHDWTIEGFYFLSASPSAAPNWYFYGNLFHDCTNSVGRFISCETPGNVAATLYVWNNTFYNVPLGIFVPDSSPGTYSSSSQVYNNIFYNCGGVFGQSVGTHDYNLYGGGNTIEGKEAHGINAGSTSPCLAISGDTPPESPGTANYALTGATSARGNGLNLYSNFTAAINGNLPSGGSWDIGAYAYAAGGIIGSATPQPPNGLRITQGP